MQTTLVGTTVGFSAMSPLGGAGLAGMSKALPITGNIMGMGMVVDSLNTMGKSYKKKRK